MNVKQAVILAGGRGSRLKPITNSIPKPMVDVNGKPFLHHLLVLLRDQGITEVLVLTGYLGNQIQDYFGSGAKLNLKITYFHTPISWSTGERLMAAESFLEQIFLLVYADNYALFDLKNLAKILDEKQAAMVLTLYSKYPGNVSIICGKPKYDKDRSLFKGDYVELGFSLLNKKKFLPFLVNAKCSLTTAMAMISDEDELEGLVTLHPYFSVSDISRLERTKKALMAQNIILLDRDGIINVKAKPGEYISRLEDFLPIRENWNALKILADDGFKFIIITNQAGIGRGMITKRQVERLHETMLRELGKEGVKFLEIYICPHHWEEKCNCRKPKPGLFFTAAEEHSFLLSDVLCFGDSTSDMEAAKSAGCNPILINSSDSKDFENLEEAIPFILRFYANKKSKYND